MTHILGRFAVFGDETDAGVSRWVKARRSSVALRTLQLEARTVRQFLRWCERKGRISSVPDVVTPRVPDDGVARFQHVGPVKLEELLVGMTPWVKAAVRGLWGSGLRIGELWALEAADIEPGRVYVRPGKTLRGRMVPLDDSTERALRVFVDAGGGKRSQQAVRKALAARDPKLTPHQLRHSRAKLWADQYPLYQVCAWLGHGDLKTTQRYLDVRATFNG